MSLQEIDWYRTEIPEVFRQVSAVEDPKLRASSEKTFRRRIGQEGSPQKIDAFILSDLTPYTYASLVAGAMITASETASLANTPLVELDPFNSASRLFVKQENLQVTGSFEVSGILYAALNNDSPDVDTLRTFGSWNQARSLAHVTRGMNWLGEVVVPDNIDESRASMLKAMGVTVIRGGQTYDDLERVFGDRSKAAAKNIKPLHLTSNHDVLVGNSRLISQAIEQTGGAKLNRIYLPHGSGGLAEHGGMILREFFGKEVDIVTVQVAQEENPQVRLDVDGWMGGVAMGPKIRQRSLIRQSGLIGAANVRQLQVSTAEAAQGMADYRIVSNGQLIDLAGAAAYAGAKKEAADHKGNILVITNGGNVTEDEVDSTVKTTIK